VSAPTLEQYVRAGELASLMGVSLSTVKRWRAAGCPAETWGMGVVRYLPSEVMAWRREQSAALVDDSPHQPAQRDSYDSLQATPWARAVDAPGGTRRVKE
jgi:hypothetical protein